MVDVTRRASACRSPRLSVTDMMHSANRPSPALGNMLVQISIAVSNGMVDFLLMLVSVSTGISLLADPASDNDQLCSRAAQISLDGLGIQAAADVPALPA